MILIKHAFVRTPADSFPKALRMVDTGEVDLVWARKQHEQYCTALESFGFELIQLSKDNNFPDSVFVEDPAIIIKDSLIISRLRDHSRRGEEAIIEKALTPFFSRIFHIESPGFIEGGDVLVTDNHLYIGLSKRTNFEGAEQLARIAKETFGYSATLIDIPESYLDLKGEATYHPSFDRGMKDIITVSEEILDHFSESFCKMLVTPLEKRFGGNNISDNGRILVHKGREKTKDILEKEGFHVQELDLSEFGKVDGAMSCLSKLYLS